MMNELDGMTALIVEPNQSMRSSFHNMFTQCGLTKVDQAPAAGQAIRHVQSKKYDIILCEYDLDGGQDGQQLLEDLRHHNLINAATMFFMVTSEGAATKVASAAELGPTDYILKPFTVDRLMERIARALEKRNLFVPIYQLIGIGNQREAIAQCLRGETSHPRYAVDFQRLRAEMHMVLGEPEQAEPLYNELFETKQIGWARLGLAKSLFMRERYEDARLVLIELVETNRKFVDAYDWLAKTYEALGEKERALEVLAEAVAVSPHAVRRLRRYGEVALETGDIETAEKTLKSVVAKAKYSEFRDPEDHVKLVKTLVKKGDTDAAAAAIRELDKTMSNVKNTALCSAVASVMLHQATGNEERLAQAMETAVAASRDSLGVSNDLKMDLARACLQADNEQAAQEVMMDVMRNASNNAAMAKAMSVFEEAGRPELAQTLAQDSRQQVIALVQAGAARVKDGDFRAGVALMVEAVNKLPENPAVVFNAALAVLKCLENMGWEDRLGEYALSLIDTVRRLDPTNPKLGALANLHQAILKKYNIRAGRVKAVA
jgi:DNA-binding response OmpR family regulator/thioredoxin-like negative regulator of GroEL